MCALCCINYYFRYLKEVKVEEDASKKNWKFLCNRWLAKDEGDGSIEADFDVDSPNPPGLEGTCNRSDRKLIFSDSQRTFYKKVELETHPRAPAECSGVA